jgi:hypothetical protein
MADETLNRPPFPPLTWDGYFWTGEVTLPSWAGFQTRRGPYASVSADKPSDGTARLTVTPLDDDARTRPTPEQAAAFQHLIANEAAVAAAVGQALVDYYPGEKEAYLDDFDEGEAEELPDVTEPSGLRSLIGLSSVHVLAVARDGAAYIGFEFGCVWDGEHGAGVMTHRGRVVATGQADVSFLAWVARRDTERGRDRA